VSLSQIEKNSLTIKLIGKKLSGGDDLQHLPNLVLVVRCFDKPDLSWPVPSLSKHRKTWPHHTQLLPAQLPPFGIITCCMFLDAIRERLGGAVTMRLHPASLSQMHCLESLTKLELGCVPWESSPTGHLRPDPLAKVMKPSPNTYCEASHQSRVAIHLERIAPTGEFGAAWPELPRSYCHR
jgi:hypothetical protein